MRAAWESVNHKLAGRLTGQRARRLLLRIAVPAVVGIAIGCAPKPSSYGGGCGSQAPQAADAGNPVVLVQNSAPPCSGSNEGVRGSNPHLLVSLTCPGESKPFLVAVKIDGEFHSLR